MRGNNIYKSKTIFPISNSGEIRFKGIGIFLSTAFNVVVYLSLEWVFIVTTSSYLDRVAPFTKLYILLYSIAYVVGFITLLVLPLFFLEKALPSSKVTYIASCVYEVLPTFILTSLLLILFDNYTYTMFRFEIVNSGTLQRVMYAVGFILITIFIFTKVQTFVGKISRIWANTSKSKKMLFIQYLS